MVNNYDGYGCNDGVKKDHIQRLWSWSKYGRYNGANSVNTESVRHLGPYRYKQNSLTYDSEGNLWALITDNYGRAYSPSFAVLSNSNMQSDNGSNAVWDSPWISSPDHPSYAVNGQFSQILENDLTLI